MHQNSPDKILQDVLQKYMRFRRLYNEQKDPTKNSLISEANSTVINTIEGALPPATWKAIQELLAVANATMRNPDQQDLVKGFEGKLSHFIQNQDHQKQAKSSPTLQSFAGHADAFAIMNSIASSQDITKYIHLIVSTCAINSLMDHSLKIKRDHRDFFWVACSLLWTMLGNSNTSAAWFLMPYFLIILPPLFTEDSAAHKRLETNNYVLSIMVASVVLDDPLKPLTLSLLAFAVVAKWLSTKLNPSAYSNRGPRFFEQPHAATQDSTPHTSLTR